MINDLGKKEKLKSINVLKGIAIMMVILVHSYQIIPDINLYVRYFVSYGQMGCQLFFLVSGFAICLSWFNMKTEGNKKLRYFYIKRFISIAPGYYIMILFYFILSFYLRKYELPFTSSRNIAGIVINLLFLHGLVPFCNNNVVHGGWFIGTIMLIYLVFPIVITYVEELYNKKEKNINNLPIIFLMVSVLVQAVIAAITGTTSLSQNNMFLYLNILNQFPCFLIGVVLYYHYQSGKLKKYDGKFAFLMFFLFTILSVMLFFSGIPMIFSIIPFTSTVSYYWLFVILNYHVDLISKKSVLKSITNILEKFGMYSYQAFLVHFIFTWYMPTAILNILKMMHIKYNGTIFYFIILGFIYIFTYVFARILDKVIKIIQRKLKNILL